MQRRQITLEDGRYLIFYTFTDEGSAASADDAEASAGTTAAPSREQPEVQPVAEEERRV